MLRLQHTAGMLIVGKFLSRKGYESYLKVGCLRHRGESLCRHSNMSQPKSRSRDSRRVQISWTRLQTIDHRQPLVTRHERDAAWRYELGRAAQESSASIESGSPKAHSRLDPTSVRHFEVQFAIYLDIWATMHQNLSKDGSCEIPTLRNICKKQTN